MLCIQISQYISKKKEYKSENEVRIKVEEVRHFSNSLSIAEFEISLNSSKIRLSWRTKLHYWESHKTNLLAVY